MKASITHARVIELRKNCRYRLSVPVFFYWATPNGVPESSQGMTRDIDTKGAYILSSALPPVGALVQMDIMLPNFSDGRPGAHLTGEGVVLRVEPGSGKLPRTLEGGIAVSMQFYVESPESILSDLKRSERAM